MKPLIAVILFAFALSAQGQTLWQNLSVGMTPEQVHKLYPEAKRDGEGLQLNGVTVASRKFDATFGFTEKKLRSVMFDLVKPSGSDAQSAFRALVAALKAKYGPEVANDRQEFLWRVTWSTKDAVTIELMWLSAFPGGKLNVIYSTSPATDAANL